ncbi:g12821 [Coccomyxa viridis]|uniref:G12821 protein n=1 Tax=Coccomyxa viridis TaxID=1274662 RepID=A0ABP1GFM5_9CHLO
MNGFEPHRSHISTVLDTRAGGYILAAGAAALFPVLRVLLDRYVFMPLGRASFFPSRTELKKSDVKPDYEDLNSRLFKYKESFWKAAVYTVLVALGVYVSINESFFTDTRYFWLGCTEFPPCNYEVSRGLRLLYALELGYYVQAIPSLIFWEVRRKDFWEQMAHHVATIGLITYSYQVNFVKVGAMVFLCHDINDIFMEGAKMARYADHKWLPTALFAVFMLSWFTSRIYYFPVYVIRSVYYEPIELVAKVYDINPHPHWEIFLSLLCFLFALHLYWSYLILRVAWRQLFGDGQAEDVRED